MCEVVVSFSFLQLAQSIQRTQTRARNKSAGCRRGQTTTRAGKIVRENLGEDGGGGVEVAADDAGLVLEDRKQQLVRHHVELLVHQEQPVFLRHVAARAHNKVMSHEDEGCRG